MTRRFAKRIGGILFAVGLAATANAPAAVGAAALTIKVGAPDGDGGLGGIPFLVAQRNGYFAKEGVNVEIVRYSGPTGMDALWNIFDGLNKGEVDLVRTQGPFLIEQVVMKGRDFVAIAANMSNPVHTLVAGPNIKNFSDLKGKTVGLTRLNDAITIASRKLMARHGLKANDVTIKSMEGSGPRFACLKSGECAAASVNQPLDSAAVAQGYHRLGISNEAGQLVFGLDATSNKWARAHEDVLVRYVRAMASALRYVNDPKNDAAVLKLIMEATKADETVSRDILRTFRDPKNHVFSHGGEIDMKAFADTIAFEGEYGQVPKPLPTVAKLVDTRYLAAAGIK